MKSPALCLIPLSLALLPLAAQAQSLTLSNISLQSTAHYATLGSQPAGEETAYDALQEFTVSNQMPASLSVPSPLNLFCVEIGQDAPGTGNEGSNPSINYSILPIADADQGRSATSFEAYSGMPVTGIGAGTAGMLENLYGYVFPSYTNASPLSISLTQAGIGSTDAAYNSAVFQLAVWQIAETGTMGPIATSGTNGSGFYAYVPSNTPTPSDQATLISDADMLLAAVAADSNIVPLSLVVLHNADAQDYILPNANGSLTPIPEPAPTAALLGLAAAAALLGRRQLALIA